MCAAHGPSRWGQMCLRSLRFSTWPLRETGLCSVPCCLQSLWLCAGPFVASDLQPFPLQHEKSSLERLSWLNRGLGTRGLQQLHRERQWAPCHWGTWTLDIELGPCRGGLSPCIACD